MVLEIGWIKPRLDSNFVESIDISLELDGLFRIRADGIERVVVDSVETIITTLIIARVLRFESLALIESGEQYSKTYYYC